VQGLNVLYGAIVWFLLLSVPVGAATLLFARRRHRMLPAGERRRVVGLELALSLSLLGIACVTLLPVGDYQTGLAWGLQLRPFASIRQQLTSAIDASVVVRIVGFNVLLFVPLGFLLRLRTGRWAPTLAAVVTISMAVEVLQAVLPLGRTSNVDDVILNTLGGSLGAAGASLVVRLQPARTKPDSGHGDRIAG
jgi:hypothetical protein